MREYGDTIFYFLDNVERDCPFKKKSVCCLKYDDESHLYEPCHYYDTDMGCPLDDYDVKVINNECQFESKED